MSELTITIAKAGVGKYNVWLSGPGQQVYEVYRCDMQTRGDMESFACRMGIGRARSWFADCFEDFQITARQEGDFTKWTYRMSPPIATVEVPAVKPPTAEVPTAEVPTAEVPTAEVPTVEVKAAALFGDWQDERRPTKTCSFRLPKPYRALLRQIAKRNRRTLIEELKIAIELSGEKHNLTLQPGEVGPC
jgi:hypothetical protein